jgi:hypothetical protein
MIAHVILFLLSFLSFGDFRSLFLEILFVA